MRATNAGNRSVTIVEFGWAIYAPGDRRTYCRQNVPNISATHVEISHGRSAELCMDIDATKWLDFMAVFLSGGDLRKLRAVFMTSLGDIVEVAPQQPLLDRLRWMQERRGLI
ncbi:hypothetical protein RA8CHR_00569 [Variovorax sp. RA8]|nr:hypothetical protein RA8CHR_00569 [Variovorax sp. RA8]